MAKKTCIPVESPVYIVVERFRKSKAAYATGYGIGDSIRFRGNIKSNKSFGRNGGVHQSYYELLKVAEDGSETIIAEMTPIEIGKAFTIATPTTEIAKMTFPSDKPVFRIALPEDAEAFAEGVSVEDLYA